MRALILMLALILAAGCSKEKTDVTPAAGNRSPAPKTSNPKEVRLQALMHAAFGNQYRPSHNDAFADLPDPENRRQINAYVVTPVTTAALKDGTTVLVTNAVLADETGAPDIAHATAGLLCIYFLRSENGQWKVIKKQENVAQLGSFGNLGQVEWATLGENRPGMVIINGGTWQGESISFIAIFDLTATDIHDLAFEPIKIQSDNDGNCISERDTCWHIAGEWEFTPGTSQSDLYDLVIRYKGRKTRMLEDRAGQSSDVSTTARYVFDGRVYRLAEGVNPVPEI